MKKIPLLLLSLFYPIILLSQSINISETDALKVATNQYALVLNAKENINYSTINAYTISSLAENDTLLAYVIGFKNRKGFVILPAIIYYDPWIAVSTESNFNTENVIPPLQMVLESVKSNILNSLRFPGENSSRHKLLWSRLASIDASCFSGREPFEYDTIGPLITSTWSQGKYYNASCPAVYGGDASQDWRALAGCGPIAMAQIIRFHEWPPEYNFSNMPNSLINYNQDVAKLISDCGEAADAWYHENWTSVWPWEVDDALKNGFGYSSAVYQDRISSFSIGESWKQRIANHLRNNYPVIYYGREEWTFSAHLFILDGFVGLDLYSPNLFHVNWGWAGNYDGYFDLDDLTPSNYNFNDIQGMIHPIRPPGKVTITNPVAGQHVLSSHELTVEWTCTDQAADMEHAMIIFHMPNHWGDTIVEQTDNDGSYTFTVPNQPNDDVKAGIEVWVYGKYKFRDILWRHENPFYVDNGSSLSITAPTYSTSWRANTIQQISWDSYPHNGVNLKIDFYNTNQGFGNVVHSTTGIAYNWLIPEHLSGQYYITMRDLNDDLSFYETSNLFTILPAKTIEITSPHYNDQYTLGDVLDIRWNDDISENVKIKLQRWDDWDPRDTVIIAESTASDGVFDWTIPDTLEDGTLYTLLINSVDHSSISDGTDYFTVRKGIRITAPTAPAGFYRNEVVEVLWRDNFIDHVKIDLYKNGNFYRNLENSSNSDGAYEWLAYDPAYPLYKIKICNVNDTTIYDISNTISILEPLYVEVTSPAFFERWLKRYTYEIDWDHNSPPAHRFTIKLINNTLTPSVNTIIDNNALPDYQWQVPSNIPTSPFYMIKVINNEDTAVTSSHAVILDDTPFVDISLPASSTSWPTATKQTITWVDNLSEGVEIEVYRDNSDALIEVIDSNTPSDGQYDWFIPQTYMPANDYYLVLRSVALGDSVEDVSDQFSITQGDYILVTSPETGDIWPAGSTQEITWDDNLPGNVMIILKKNTINYIDTLTSSTPGDGSWSWNIDALQGGYANYKMEIRSVDNASVFDDSDPFEISTTLGSFITVLSPTEDSVWTMNSSYLIEWVDNIPVVKEIELYKNDICFADIAVDQAGPNYLWNIPDTLEQDTTYNIKVLLDTYYDYSGEFTILELDFINSVYVHSAFRMGETAVFKWSDNIDENVKIELFHADTLYGEVIGSTDSDGQYLWPVPCDLPVSFYFDLKITSLSDTSVHGIADSLTIQWPYDIDVTSPQAGDFWLVDSPYKNYDIEWEHNWVIPGKKYVRIDLFKEGDSLCEIEPNIAITALTFNWTINLDTLSSGVYQIRVLCKQRPDIWGMSDDFSIVNCSSFPLEFQEDTVTVTNNGLGAINASLGFTHYSWVAPWQPGIATFPINGADYALGYHSIQCYVSFYGGCFQSATAVVKIIEDCRVNAAFTWFKEMNNSLCNTFTFVNASDSSYQYWLKWYFGDGDSLVPGNTVVSHTYANPGQYKVTCVVTDSTLIMDCTASYADTVEVTASPVFDFDYANHLDTVWFTPQVSGIENYQIVWSMDSLEIITDQESPIYIFPENDTFNICMKIVDSVFNACEWEYCENVIIDSLSPCRFTRCSFGSGPHNGYGGGERKTFHVWGGADPAMECYTVLWNMGDGNNYSDTFEIIHTYADTGTYFVQMTVTNCDTCSYTYMDTIMAYDDFVLHLPADTSGCDSLTVQADTGYIKYIWNDSTFADRLVTVTTGQYWVMVMDGTGYYAMDTTNVSVYQTPDVYLSALPVKCPWDPDHLFTEGQPFGGIYSGDYIYSVGLFYWFAVDQAGAGFHPIAYAYTNVNGCGDTAYALMEVEPEGPLLRVLQNDTIDTATYITGVKIISGEEVTDTIPYGIFLVQAGASLILKAEDTIILKPGTIIQSGSAFRATIGTLNCLAAPPTREVTALNEHLPEHAGITVSPNPAFDNITLHNYDPDLRTYQLVIYNSIGKPVFARQNITANTYGIRINNFSPGLYIIHIWNNNKQEVVKFIKW